MNKSLIYKTVIPVDDGRGKVISRHVPVKQGYFESSSDIPTDAITESEEDIIDDNIEDTMKIIGKINNKDSSIKISEKFTNKPNMNTGSRNVGMAFGKNPGINKQGNKHKDLFANTDSDEESIIDSEESTMETEVSLIENKLPVLKVKSEQKKIDKTKNISHVIYSENLENYSEVGKLTLGNHYFTSSDNKTWLGPYKLSSKLIIKPNDMILVHSKETINVINDMYCVFRIHENFLLKGLNMVSSVITSNSINKCIALIINQSKTNVTIEANTLFAYCIFSGNNNNTGIGMDLKNVKEWHNAWKPALILPKTITNQKHKEEDYIGF